MAFSMSTQYLGHTYNKKLLVTYLKFKFDWMPYIFICSIWQFYSGKASYCGPQLSSPLGPSHPSSQRTELDSSTEGY